MPGEPKEELHHYLQDGRKAMLSKLDGLSEYDVRRPLTPTGTNLLGLVKHLAIAEIAYFGHTFDGPSSEPLPRFDEDAEPNADMWAPPISPEPISWRCTAEHGNMPTPRLMPLPWTLSVTCHGGRRSGERSRSTACWYSWLPRRTGTRVMLISSGSSLTAWPGCGGKATI